MYSKEFRYIIDFTKLEIFGISFKVLSLAKSFLFILLLLSRLDVGKGETWLPTEALMHIRT